MNKRGFTLIELLAVIILLTVIALIATPAIINIIENARKKAFENSAYGVLEGLRLDYIERTANTTSAEEKIFTFPNNDLKLSGKMPTYGKAKIDKNGYISFVLADKDKKWCAKKEYNLELVEIKKYTEEDCLIDDDNETGNVTSDGKIIYFNPVSGSLCNDYQKENSINENKSGCMKWYTFGGNNNSDYINLLLDHNTTYHVAYNSKNISTINEAKTALDKDTSLWQKDLKVRLITADEIAKITGNKNFNSLTSGYKDWFYLDTNTTSYAPNRGEGTSKYYFLFDYLSDCTEFGCKVSDSKTYGYWVQTKVKDKSSSIWYISINGTLSDLTVTNDSDCGIRPVITVKKERINM